MQKKMDFVKNVLFWSVAAALYYTGVKYLLPALLPLILAFGTVWGVDHLCRPISQKLSLSHTNLRLYVLLLLFCGALVCIYFAVRFALPALQQQISSLPYIYQNTIRPLIAKIGNMTDKVFTRFIKGSSSSFDLADTLTNQGLLLATDIAKRAAVGMGKVFPSMMMHVAFYLMCCLLFAADFEKVKTAPMRFLSKERQMAVTDILQRTAQTLFGMVKAAAQLSGIVFFILWAGFWLIGAGHPFLTAAAAAVIDLLPVFGCGIVLLPMSGAYFLSGNVFSAVGCLCLYGIVSTAKSILEPRLTGKQVGLHPALSLILAFFGMRLFGVWGIPVLPLTGVLVLSYLTP